MIPAPGSSTWPAHGRITLPWHSEARRGAKADRLVTEVEAWLPPRIAELTFAANGQCLRPLDDAARSVVALDAGFGDRLASLGAFLVRNESVSSSKIEYVEASAEDFARALIGIRANSSALSMVAATKALGELVADAGRTGVITSEAILEAHSVLMKDDRLDGPFAGRYRRVQNWIGGSDYSPRMAVYVPPPPETVVEYMDDLLVFANRDDVHPIVQASIAHAQFESIHPFTDGNGRIGRALVNAIFRRRGLTTTTVTPVASALVADTARYFGHLGDYRRGDPAPFVEELAVATSTASTEAAESARVFERLPAEWHEAVQSRAGSASSALVDVLLDNPILTSHDAERLVGGPITSIYRAIDRLVDVGVLQPITDRKRDRVWAATAVLDELDDLTARIGARIARVQAGSGGDGRRREGS